MKKQIISFLTCGLLVICFCFPVYAANQYPTGSGSGSINGVSYYYTVDDRGDYWENYDRNTRITAMSAALNGTVYTYSITNSNTYNWDRSSVVHVSMTIRNRNTKIAVADLNNFQLRYTGTLSVVPTYIGVVNWSNADVYNIDYNPSASSPSFQINFRSTESLVLMPDQQLDIQFDLVLTQEYSGSSSSVGSIYGSDFVNMTLNQMPGSFTLYTVEEYADTFEGFDSFYVRTLGKLYQIIGYNSGYTINNLLDIIRQKLNTIIENQNPTTQQSDEISDSSESVAFELETAHDQEQQWYSDNDAAIAQTGLSNFEYSQDQLTGISHVVGQWTQVWSALGSWNTVYIFTLMLSLATFIIRHEPTTKIKQKRELRDMYYSSGINRNFATTDYYNLAYKDLNDRRNYRSSEGGSGDLLRRSLKKR